MSTMAVPLAVAAPATAAGLLYLNAKWSVSYDFRLLVSLLSSMSAASSREKKGRLNPFYVLEDRAKDKKYADNVFIIFEGRRWTFKQVYETTLKYGTWLKTSFGVKHQEIVAMDFMNSEKFLFMQLGLWSIGARPGFLNYNLTGKPLAHCIRVSSTRLVLVDPDVANNATDEVRAELPGVEFVVFTPQLEVEVMHTTAVRQPDSERAAAKMEDMANLIYTSGTTGLPKPAVVSWHKNIAAPVAVAKWMGLKKTDIFYTCMPLYHSSASILGFMPALENGSAFALGRKFSTKTFWQEVRESEATVIQYVGETCRYLLSAPPQFGPSGENLDKENKVRIAFGNGLRPDVWNKFKERFGINTIAEFYSATESVGMGLNYSRNEFGRGAIGRNGTLVRLVFGPPAVIELDPETSAPVRDAKGFCKRMPAGEPGELLYILDANDIEKKFQGYLNNNKANNSKIIKDVFKKGDAYFRTGDMVRATDDGLLYFVDRIGDTYRWKSENVSTNEVAECISTHPSVQEANVYGIELPNHDGRAGCAALVLTGEPSPQVISSLAETAQKGLPRFAVPLFLRVTKSMETTGTNKQQKHVLRSQGVDPSKVGDDQLFWLKDGTYVNFGQKDWLELQGGRVKL